MLREIFVALAVVAFATPASACPDQKGKVIFEDTFTDDSGGWELYAPVSEIKDGSLRLHPNLADGDDKNTRVLNQTFSAVDGDYCVEFVLPAKLDPVNSIAFSLLFFAQNVDNMFMWLIITPL